MKKLMKASIKALSIPKVNMKKNYRRIRRVLNVVYTSFKPSYNALDHKIMVGDREIPVRVFMPKEVSVQRKILLFFHGGGWVTGNIDTYTNICASLAEYTNNVVISVDYRLAPENPFPAGFKDCYTVAKELFSLPYILNCDECDITLMGDSAGANLAAAVSLAARDIGEFMPHKQILLYPATYFDHSQNSPFPSIKQNANGYIMTSQRIVDYLDLYVRDKKYLKHPYVAPIMSKSYENQPKTLIITAEFDPLRDEGEYFGLKLKEAGNDVNIYRMKSAIHGFFSTPWLSDYTLLTYRLINKFLND